MSALFVLIVLMAFGFVLDCFMRAVKAVRKANRVIEAAPVEPTPLYRGHVRLVNGDDRNAS